MKRIRIGLTVLWMICILANAFTPLSAQAEGAPVPVIVEVAPNMAAPDETVQLIGQDLVGSQVGIRLLPDTIFDGTVGAQMSANKSEADITGQPEALLPPLLSDANSAAGVIPSNWMHGQYVVWAVNSAGRSNPMFVNKTDVMYVYPNTLNLAVSREVTVIGTNLTYNNGSGIGGSRVYLRNKTTSQFTQGTLKSATPYEMVFQVPDSVTEGSYDEVWVNNGHGGEFGWSKTDITLINAPPPTAVYNVTDPLYGAIPNDEVDDGPAIQKAIDAAHAAGGGTVLLPEGIYHLDKEGTLPAAGLTKLVDQSTFGATPSYGTDREYFRAFDSNSTTFFDFTGTGPGYTGIDLGEGNAKPVTVIRFFPRPSTNATIDADMIGGKFQGSNDNVTYTDLYTVEAKPSFSGNVVKTTNSSTPFRYLRYIQPDTAKKGYIAEMEFFTGTPQGALTVGAKPEAQLQKLTLKANVTLKGQGADKTTLKYLDTGSIGGRDTGVGPEMITVTGSKTGIEGLRIEGSDSIDRGIVIHAGLQDITIRNNILNTWYPGPAKKAMMGGIWGDGGASGLTRVLLENNEITSGGTLNLYKLYNSKISNNTFRGKAWTPVTFTNSYQNVITGNKIDGRDDSGKRGGSRGFNFTLHPSSGSYKPTAMNYIARNDTQYIGNESSPTNDGEILLFDALVDVDTDFTGSGNKILHYGSVSASGSDQATVKGMSWSSNVLKDEYVLVVEGKGLGQFRKITGNTSDTITVEKGWTIVPDTTSRVAISRFFYRNIVTDNTASNNKGNDMRMYGQVVGNIFDNNRSVLGNSGSPTAGNGGTAINSFDRNLTTYHPSYYNVIKNSSGARANISFGGNLRIDSPRSVSAMGNTVKNNQVGSLYVISGGYDFFPAPKQNLLYNVFERNTSSSRFQIDSPVAGATIVRNNILPGATPEERYYNFGTGTVIIENNARLNVARPQPPQPPELPGNEPMPNPGGNKLVLQQGISAYQGAADASLMSHWQGLNNNNGAYGEFEMARYNGGGVDDKYGLIKFDVSMIDPTRPILGAYLELYHTQTRASSENFKTVDVHRITSSWEEGNGNGNGTSIDGNTVGTVVDGVTITGVTMNTRPSWETGADTTLDSVVTSYVPGNWYHFDVTQAAKEWVLHPESNFGVVLLEDLPSRANGTRTFASSQNSNLSIRPKLTVFYSGDPIVPPVDSVPPGDVTEAVAVTADGMIKLTWKDSEDTDLMKVRVYADGRLLAEVDRGVQAAALNGLDNGRLYQLRIVSVDGSGNTSQGRALEAMPRSNQALFWKGINLNGQAVIINENPWVSYNQAKTEGLTVTAAGAAPTLGTTANFPLPFQDIYDVTHMLNTNVNASKKPLKLEQNVPNGSYRVYLWFIETSSDRSRSFNLDVEGRRAATQIGSEIRNRYARYGPYDTSVTDGALTLDIGNVKGDPVLSGLEIYKDYRSATLLKDLRVGGQTVTDFVYEPSDYTLFLPPFTTDVPHVAADGMDSSSMVTVTQAVYLPGTAEVRVQSADSRMESVYRVHFNLEEPSTNNLLADLTVNGATLYGFLPERTVYSLQLPYGTSVVPAVYGLAQDAKATVKIMLPLELPGSATVEIKAENGDKRLYTIQFTLASPPENPGSGNAGGQTSGSGNTTVTLPASEREAALNRAFALLKSEVTPEQLKSGLNEVLKTIASVPSSMFSLGNADGGPHATAKKELAAIVREAGAVLARLKQELTRTGHQDLVKALNNQLDIPVPGQGRTLVLSIPGDIVQALKETGLEVRLIMKDVVFGIPSEAWSTGAEATGVDLTVRGADQGDAKEAADRLAVNRGRMEGAYEKRSTLYEFGMMQPEGASGAARFNRDIHVELPYAAGSMDVSKLGVYLYNPERQTWDYVGGKVNEAAKTVAFTTGHFSSYTVMAYDKSFPDIVAHWAKKDIEAMASRHVADGADNGLFLPDQSVSRAEFAAWVVRGLGLAEATGGLKFGDVAADAWYAPYIVAVSSHGLMTGEEQGQFRPAAPITREEMAAVLVRALGTKAGAAAAGGSQQRFADQQDVSSWASGSVLTAARLGLVEGNEEGAFKPQDQATRAEALVIIGRWLKLQ
ncbi:S-layer homology domain-containing protein [Paenibacillus silviterrae]|uniref:S-layer homology domain-containing protein n=1 Tax=Paenibacillus silviterrae TaxID=3242194 RepID=UPI0025434D59|nr:S-layer homology domain-containing protein [Paenibacillus chinjuensis]